jgi:hypothetical protein
VEDVGDSNFMEQHRRKEKLNIQVHQNAMTNSDEFVLESILLYEKLETLIDNRITIEGLERVRVPQNYWIELLGAIAFASILSCIIRRH